MKTLPTTTTSAKLLQDAPILIEPERPALKAASIPVAFTAAHPAHLAIHGQPQYYFIPSSRPLWQNPLNDF